MPASYADALESRLDEGGRSLMKPRHPQPLNVLFLSGTRQPPPVTSFPLDRQRLDISGPLRPKNVHLHRNLPTALPPTFRSMFDTMVDPHPLFWESVVGNVAYRLYAGVSSWVGVGGYLPARADDGSYGQPRFRILSQAPDD